MKKNADVREALAQNHVYFYELADIIGCSESTLTKRMRHELPQEERKAMIEGIRAYANNFRKS